MCFLFMLYDAKSAVDVLQPLPNGSEFQILNTAWSSDKLDILNPLGQCKSIKLLNFRYAIVIKKLLDICVETTRFETFFCIYFSSFIY